MLAGTYLAHPHPLPFSGAGDKRLTASFDETPHIQITQTWEQEVTPESGQTSLPQRGAREVPAGGVQPRPGAPPDWRGSPPAARSASRWLRAPAMYRATPRAASPACCCARGGRTRSWSAYARPTACLNAASPPLRQRPSQPLHDDYSPRSVTAVTVRSHFSTESHCRTTRRTVGHLPDCEEPLQDSAPLSRFRQFVASLSHCFGCHPHQG